MKAGLTKTQLDTTVGVHPTAAEELVTMRTPARKIRNGPPSEVLFNTLYIFSLTFQVNVFSLSFLNYHTITCYFDHQIVHPVF